MQINRINYLRRFSKIYKNKKQVFLKKTGKKYEFVFLEKQKKQTTKLSAIEALSVAAKCYWEEENKDKSKNIKNIALSVQSIAKSAQKKRLSFKHGGFLRGCLSAFLSNGITDVIATHLTPERKTAHPKTLFSGDTVAYARQMTRSLLFEQQKAEAAKKFAKKLSTKQHKKYTKLLYNYQDSKQKANETPQWDDFLNQINDKSLSEKINKNTSSLKKYFDDFCSDNLKTEYQKILYPIKPGKVDFLTRTWVGYAVVTLGLAFPLNYSIFMLLKNYVKDPRVLKFLPKISTGMLIASLISISHLKLSKAIALRRLGPFPQSKKSKS